MAIYKPYLKQSVDIALPVTVIIQIEYLSYGGESMNRNKALIALLLLINVSFLSSMDVYFKESTVMGVVAVAPAALVALVWQVYTYPLVPIYPGLTYERYLQANLESEDYYWYPYKHYLRSDSSLAIPLQRAFAVGLIVKLGLDAYEIYLDWIHDRAQQLKKAQRKQEEKETFVAELKFTDRAAIEQNLLEQIKNTLREVIDLKIVESEVFPTRKIKIFVLQNIRDFFTFAHKPELNLFVYQVAMQMINDLQRDLSTNRSTDQEIVVDAYRDYYIKRLSKPFLKMSDAELKEVKKDFELIIKSERAIASANIRNDNEYERAINKLMKESISLEQKMVSEQTMESAKQKFALPLSVILENTALVSLITHIEFMLNMRPKGEIFHERRLLQVEALQAKKYEPLPRKEQYQTIAAALKAKGVELTPIIKQKFPQQRSIQIPIQNQEILLPAQEQKPAQQPTGLWSRIKSWFGWK